MSQRTNAFLGFFSEHFLLEIFAARKQGLGQGNIFTGVYLSTGGLCMMSLPVQGASVQERVSVQGSLSGGFLSRGLCLWRDGGTLSKGSVSGERGLCLEGSLSKQFKTPLYSKEWMVCILLECILVKYYIYYIHLRTENHYIV